MSNYATVDPGNTSIIDTHDVNGVLLRDGATVTLPDFAGGTRSPFMINNAPVPAWNLYNLTNDDTPCGPPSQYYVRTLQHSFSGTVGVSGTVTELAVCSQIPIDDLYQQKLVDLIDYQEIVRVQSVRSTSNTNFWIVLSQGQRDFLGSANAFLTDRLKDRTLGRDSALGYDPNPPQNDPSPLTYWARDVPVLLIRDSNGNRLVSDVNEAAWGQVLKDIGIYDFASRDAEVNVTNALGAALDADDWQTLADIDVQDSIYGWPDYYTGTVSISIRANVGRRLR